MTYSGENSTFNTAVGEMLGIDEPQYVWRCDLGGAQLFASRCAAFALEPLAEVERLAPSDNLKADPVNISLPGLRILAIEASEAVPMLFKPQTGLLLAPHKAEQDQAVIDVAVGLPVLAEDAPRLLQAYLKSEYGYNYPFELQDLPYLRDDAARMLGHVLASQAGLAAAETLKEHYVLTGQEYLLSLASQVKFIQEFGRGVTNAIHSVFCDEVHDTRTRPYIVDIDGI